MMTHIQTNFNEEGHYTVTCASAFTPTAMKWRLMDEDGVTINSRTSVAITSPSTSNLIELDGDDLAISDNKKTLRYVTVYGTYSGGTKHFTGGCSFNGTKLKGI